MNENLKKLRAPFPENQISLLPKPTKKDNVKGNCKECGGYHGLPAIHLKYVGHAALTDRLLDVDPLWSWEPMAFKDGLPAFDLSGGLWIRLTICGHTRLGYGNAEGSSFKDAGSREKEIIGDALRNAAMRFGAALDLWHKGDLHAHEEKDESERIPQRIVPDQPDPEDGIPGFNDGKWYFTFGTYNKKSIDQVYRNIGPEKLAQYIDTINKNKTRYGDNPDMLKTLGDAQDVIAEYLAEQENKPIE